MRLSATGRERHLLSARQAQTGVVVGFGRNGINVIVRRDGTWARESYHMDFWDPVDQPLAVDAVREDAH